MWEFGLSTSRAAFPFHGVAAMLGWRVNWRHYTRHKLGEVNSCRAEAPHSWDRRRHAIHFSLLT
jgi:hypothetical protein